MGRITRAVGVLFLLAGCATGPAQVSNDIRQAYGAKYASLDKTEVSFTSEDSPEPVAWFYMPEGLGPGLGEALGSPLRDCGNSQYRCLAVGNSIFAAPRNGPKPGDAFTVGGASFMVLSCATWSGAKCTRAFVRSLCEWRDADDVCVSADHKSDDGLEGWPTTYLLDSALGVIWWSTADACAADPLSAECKSDGGFTLQSKQGLLASGA